MSVLIKDMEMPKDGCSNCIFVNRKWHGDVCPILKREVTGNVERGGFQTDCPFVPVPPHGGLIEKNAVFKLIQSMPSVDKLLPVEFMKALQEIPTVIPAEEDER